MHLPDGFLSLPVAAGVGAASAAAVGVSLRRCRSTLDDRAEALLGVAAAGVFAAQMVNFPIPGGTSGHLLGGTLAGIVLGPWAGLVAITCVLIVQCFLFADGGLIALGANVFNMGVVGCWSGAAIWSLLKPASPNPTRAAVAAGIAAWCSTLLCAAACAVQLSLSGSFGFARTLSLMVGVHAVIGLGEALITGFVVLSLLRLHSPALPTMNATDAPIKPAAALGGGLALAAAVVVCLAPFSSELPDGLQRALAWLGGSSQAAPATAVFVADLGERLGTIAAGLIGVAIVVLLAWLAARVRPIRAAADAVNP